MSKVRIGLAKVRLTFPHLFEKQPIGGVIDSEEKRKYTATFILSKDNPKHVAVVAKIAEHEKQILNEIKLKKAPHVIVKCNDEFLDSIDDSDNAGKSKLEKCAYLKNTWSIVATNGFAPVLELVRDIPLDPSKDINPFYAGCYVNAVIELSPYKFNNNWKGITKYLLLVRFSEKGEKLGGTTVKGSDYFDDEDEDFTSDAFEDEKLF